MKPHGAPHLNIVMGSSPVYTRFGDLKMPWLTTKEAAISRMRTNPQPDTSRLGLLFIKDSLIFSNYNWRMNTVSIYNEITWWESINFNID
jgi:hypothetical protein